MAVDAIAMPLRSGFGRNSFAVSGEGCSCFRAMKFFRCLIVGPLLVLSQLLLLLWPLTCVMLCVGIYTCVKPMVDAKQVYGINVFWIIYYLFFLRFFLKIAWRPEIIPAIWVQFVERSVKFAQPGQMLEVVRRSEHSSDVLLNSNWISHQGDKAWLNLMAGHIRRSIDMTMLEELKSNSYGAGDDNIDNPQYFLSGQAGSSIEGMSEVWTCHKSIPAFPALYCFCESVPIFRFFVPLKEEETVLGHILLLKTSERIGPEDIYTMRNPCASLVPSCIGNDKVVARRGYWAKFTFGNFPAGKPDAYIFKRTMIERTNLQVAHTFRIVAPRSEHGDQLA